jgi:hypothetical protein
MAFIRVKDKDTGHEFDVREDSILLREGSVEHVKPKQYPPSRYPRPAKHHIDLSASTGATEATPEEE